MDLSEFLETCADHIRAGGAFDFGDSPLYDPIASTRNVEAGGESPNEAAKAALAPVSAAFSRLSPIHPHGFDDHADSLAARAEGAARLAGASSVCQPPFRAATTFDSVAAVNQTATEARAMTQHQIVTVDFHGQSIIASAIDGKPYVALKPLVENIGLQWEAQYKRLQRNPVLKSTMSVMDMVAEDGKTREMLCLPLSMLNGWLFGVDVNRVREEIRPKLIRYQTECFEVLAQHFMPAQRPHNPAIDYDRISPAQAQDLKELVHAIADSKVQGFGETWARLHRKFRVNSYLELPATRFAEARDYLLAKLPEPPAAPINAADGPAMAAARKVAMDYFRAFHAAAASGQPAPRMDDIPQDVLEGLVADALLRQKMLVSFDYDTGSMQTKLVPSDASVISLQKGDYTGLVHSMPMHRLPELAEALNKRVASHLGAFSQHLQSNRPALGAM